MPSLLGGVIRGFKAEFSPESADLIRGSAIRRGSTIAMQNSALWIRIGLRTPILTALSAKSRRNYATSLLIWFGQPELGGAPIGFKAELSPESTDLAKADNTGWRRPRIQGGIPPCVYGFD